MGSDTLTVLPVAGTGWPALVQSGLLKSLVDWI